MAYSHKQVIITLIKRKERMAHFQKTGDQFLSIANVDAKIM